MFCVEKEQKTSTFKCADCNIRLCNPKARDCYFAWHCHQQVLVDTQTHVKFEFKDATGRTAFTTGDKWIVKSKKG